MKRASFFIMLALGSAFTLPTLAQKKDKEIPSVVEKALKSKYPQATKVTWEKEKGNFEANWGGKSGEDMSVMFTPVGAFVEQVEAIPASSLPAPALAYIKKTFGKVKINETGKVTDAAGKVTYEAEIKHKEVVFDDKGTYLKTEKE